VRPDGTGLEIYSTGTRNILEVAISPLMDMFARDNTNDGGGWNVRFHHFTGLDDHGYPRLYKNFNDEAIQPLADYGGGSGTGAVYIDEPGFGAWNNAPFTCDWGSGALWHHQVKPKGATFEETRKPEPFIKMTRPTDADVDGLSRVYCASWKGATFGWAGPDVGYIVQVKPKGFKAEPLPDFAKAKDEELVKVLESASNRREDGGAEGTKPLNTRVAAINALTSWKPRNPTNWDPKIDNAAAEFHEFIGGIAELRKDAKLLPATLRAVSDINWGAVPTHPTYDMVSEADLLSHGLKSSDAKARVEAAITIAHQGTSDLPPDNASRIFSREALPGLIKLLGDSDSVVAASAFHALASMKAHQECFAVLDSIDPAIGTPLANPAAYQTGALLALMRIHTPEVVTGLIERLGKATDPALRQGILAALCRLHFKEGEWKGDSWGTRPDTRGPYYQPEAWSETPKIAVALKDALAKATPEEAAFLVKELNRNRIQFNEAQQRILELAKKDPKVLPELAAQLAGAEEIPAEAVPLFVGLVRQVGPVGPSDAFPSDHRFVENRQRRRRLRHPGRAGAAQEAPGLRQRLRCRLQRLLERAEARKPPSARRADRREGRVAGVDVCECRLAEPREPQNGQPGVHPAHAEGARQRLGRSEAPQAHHRRHQRLQAHAQRRQSARRAR
jgi:hypothetical protein